jgi:hypothetical protein
VKLNLVPARTGVAWVRSGLQTFFRQPLAFISLFFFFTAVVSLASQVPLVGSALALMLLPTMTLALMAATEHAAAPEKPAAGTVFLAALQAARADARPMTVLGAMYGLAFLAVMAVSALADGGQFARVYLLGGRMTREIAEQADFQVALWIAMALYLPLSLAFWHAPALVHWHRVPPAKSLFFSFVACLRNLRALTLFGLVWIGVFLGAGLLLSIAAGLIVAVTAIGAGEGAAVVGTALVMGGALVMAAMFFSSTWFSFKDSFRAD